MRRLERTTMPTTVTEMRTTLRLRLTPAAVPTIQTILITLPRHQVVIIHTQPNSLPRQLERHPLPPQSSHTQGLLGRIPQQTSLSPHIILKIMYTSRGRMILMDIRLLMQVTM